MSPRYYIGNIMNIWEYPFPTKSSQFINDVGRITVYSFTLVPRYEIGLRTSI